jgi:hypothetical protein
VDPHIFEDFVSYLNSSIYSPKTRPSGLDMITQILHAWLLGEQLGAPGFTEAAFAKLYSELEYAVREKTRPVLPPPPSSPPPPPAPAPGTDGTVPSDETDSGVAPPRAKRATTHSQRLRKAPADIHAAHIAFVCTYSRQGSFIRRLLFDSTAALFDQEQVMEIVRLVSASRSSNSSTQAGYGGADAGNLNMDAYSALGGGEVAWLQVFDNYADFRATLSGSVAAPNKRRGLLLGSALEYMPGFGVLGG